MSQHLGPVTSSPPNGSERGMEQATKPLPRLPRGWSRVCHETGLFLRSIHLGIVVTAFQGFFTKNFSEPEKAAIRQSRVTAFLRALIHTIPLGMAIFEIVLNWKGHYVGAHFDNQNYLQFVAKGHEILLQASLATIILSYTRYQISVGKGMPFGAILGALEFLQVSYLWSVELWSAILSRDFQLRKKVGFAFLILLCVTIAATAGPSSANLLIARQGTWPRKSSYLAVNATFQDLWPDRLDSEKIPSECKMLDPYSAKKRPHCPSINLNPGLTVPDILTGLKRWKNLVEGATKNHLGFVQGIRMGTIESEAIKDLLINPCFPGVPAELCFTSPQNNIADRFIDDSLLTTTVLNLDLALGSYHFLKENYYQPYTVASCVADTVQNSSDQAPLRFARITNTASEAKNDREIFSVPDLTKGQLINNLPGNVSQFRVDWVDLPRAIFRTGVPGAVIVYPQSSSDSSYNIATCTLSAGWGSSELMSEAKTPFSIASSMTKLPSSWPHGANSNDPYGFITIKSPIFVNESSFSYPQLHISISKSWMELINPTLILLDNSTINLAASLMSSLSHPPSELDTAWIFSFMFTAALANTGLESNSKVFKERAHVSTFCETCLVFEIEKFIYGWTYTTRETTTKLAIVVMLVYCVLVLAHIIYCAISGVSSTAWDSVAELVALAMNSSPTEILHNTCAGIVGRKAYETNVRVLKTSEKHLELVFGEVKDPNADISKLVMNEKYGGVGEGKEDDYETLKTEGQGGMRKRVLG